MLRLESLFKKHFIVPNPNFLIGRNDMKKYKNRWLVSLCVLILVVGIVGAVNAATVQPGQSSQQAIANWIANDPNPMPMNMNTNMNTDTVTGTTYNTNNTNTQPAANNAQPTVDTTQPATNNAQPAADTTAQNSPQPAANGQQKSQTTVPAKQNDQYNQMLKACLQMGGQMMQNARC